MKPITVYAVVEGWFSDYSVLAIFRLRADAEARLREREREREREQGSSGYVAYPRIEEFDFYEGEPTPRPVD